MKNLLVGNGINIEFGGKDFLSKWIFIRMIAKAKQNLYNDLFKADETSEAAIEGDGIVNIFNNFVPLINNAINGKYDEKVPKNLKSALTEFKKTYNEPISKPDQIGIEDWLLVFEFFYIDNPDVISQKRATLQGVERMILDAIYCDGRLQETYKTMMTAKKFFKQFEQIFTLNYDNNIEKITEVPVYHLHGDYSVLPDSENPHTIPGFARRQDGASIYIPLNFEHCFCNALLSYSGNKKYTFAKDFQNANNYYNKLKGGTGTQQENLKRGIVDLYKTIFPDEHYLQLTPNIAIEHPELQGWSDYHFSEFENIEGALFIIGVNPQNDSHIFDCICKSLENGNLEKVVYYCTNPKNMKLPDMLEKFNNLVEIKNVNDVWVKYCRNWHNTALKQSQGVPPVTAKCIYEAMEYELSKEEYRNSPPSEQALLRQMRSFARTLQINELPPEELLMFYFNYKNRFKTNKDSKKKPK
ncbi:MAG: hypothetical protein LBM38_01055 [Clostridiales bacterium]|nr:hypothetical protein [Clostridiales bacterium]